MTHHNYAGCQDPLCLRCEDYLAGYVAGRSKALFEVSTTHHPAGCGCDPVPGGGGATSTSCRPAGGSRSVQLLGRRTGA